MKKLHILIALSFLFACCSDDEQLASDLQDSRAIVLAMDRGDAGLQWGLETSTRAASTDLAADMPATLSLWGFCKNAYAPVFNNQQFYYIDGVACPDALKTAWMADFPDNDWPYDPTATWTPGRDYKFFACAPYSADAAAKASDGTTDATYADFSTVVWSVPAYSAEDYTYASVMSTPRYPADISDATLPVTMRHLMTRLRFCFRIGGKFGDLRIIRVKEMWVMNNGEQATVTIGFDASKNSKATVSSIVASSKDSVALRNEMDVPYIELSAAYNDSTTAGKPNYDSTLPKFKSLASLYLLPLGDKTSVTIRVRYDIYDTAGQLLRKDDIAKSEITLKDAVTKLPVAYEFLNPGKYRDVNITIEPEFLYVLSDNDAPDDGTVIVK